MEFFDSHSHYNDERYDNDRKEVIGSIYNEGITSTVCIGYNVIQSKKAIKIANENEFIYASVGISPNDIEDYNEESLKEIEKIAERPKVVAIGEIGLDYYWNKENKFKQKELFKRQIDIANKLNKPIIIHTRDAWQDTIDILKKTEAINQGIFHCCPLNQELIKEALKLGFYISFSGNITFKNAKSKEAVSLVPLNKILIETDCPYLTPEPFRGKRNDSRYVKLVAEKISEIKKVSLEEIAEITYKNAQNIFKINQK